MPYVLFSPLFSTTNIPLINPHTWPLLTTLLPTLSVHRDGLSSTLLKNDIRGNMWHHLRARFDKVIRPGISARHTGDILTGLPEGSRLSPTLFGIFVADLVYELRAKFPHCGQYLSWTPTVGLAVTAIPTYPSNWIYHAHLDSRPTLF